jgi:hypothetical protein
MGDSYQAIYDAVRSRISGGNIGDAVAEVARQCFDTSFIQDQIRSGILEQASEWGRPCAVFKPTLSRDGNQWCALLGDNLHEGLAGFGDTPAAAMSAFDKAFYTEKLEAKASA